MVMPDFLTTPTAQAGFAVLILCVLIALGFYLVSSFRDYAAGAPDVLANLQERHRKGDISDEEFRTIQATTHPQSTKSVGSGETPTSGDKPADTL